MPRGSAPGERRGGRQKGTPNKATREMKEIVREAFDRAGGADYLVTIAKSDPKAFCTLLGKLIPADINASLTHTVDLPQFLADVWRSRASKPLD